MVLLLLLLLLLLSTGATIPGRPPKHPRLQDAVTAASGEPCHFPFRYQRKMHHSCLRGGPPGPQPWCATTENYDRDRRWTLCAEDKRVTGACQPNPCENGGVCQGSRDGYRCVCPAHVHGQRCQKESCFEGRLLAHFPEGEKWLRHRAPSVEECRCAGGQAVCRPAHGKECPTSPCLNGGRCLQVKGERVCGCRSGYTGPFCDIDQSQACYSGSGQLYRGMAHTTLSGAQCLPWDSQLLSQELSSRSLRDALGRGLGRHAFCRNPDNDSRPWCYTLREERLSWEFCSVPPCEPQAAGAVDTTEAGLREAEPTSPSSSFAQGCGQRYKKTVSVHSRVVGGMLALPASHPYLAALYLGEHFCGGTLIASCWVLTAAHCLQHRPNVSHISVGLGQTRYNSSVQGSAELRVQDYVLHENYSHAALNHDIALVRLQAQATGRCAEFSRSILPACLPSTSEPLNTSKPCEIAGWGHLYEGARALAEHLQEAVLPIVPPEQCRAPELHGARISADMLCAGYLEGGTDACQGDSGGPLVCEEQGRATLRGIISWGVGCGEQDKPGVYTNVARYLDWIQGKLS